MKSYFIEEKDAEMTYIELRLLLMIDCDLKYDKITEILNYLNNHRFIIDLTTLSINSIPPEQFLEKENVMSLTIDMLNNKLRFKFWNGASTQWLYHLDDLFNALNMGRQEFSDLYDKYQPLTEILYDFANRWKTSVHRISYRYYPVDDDTVDVVYHFVFTQDVEDANYAGKLLKKINDEIIGLGNDITNDLKFKIEHSFQSSGCTPCEKARKERERLESQNDKGQDV